MRFRKKHFAIPEMEKSPLVSLAKEDFLNQLPKIIDSSPSSLYAELGCGKGRFLADIAKLHPENYYIGIDIEANAMISAKRLLEDEALTNAHLFLQDISVIEGIFPENSVDGLYIHFPNPWPKKRHYKRRLTHPRQLIQYHNFLKDKAQIWFKTDDTELFEASLEYLKEFGFTILFSTNDLHTKDDPSHVITEYEEKWRAQGMKIKAILAQKESIAPPILHERLEQFSLREKADRDSRPADSVESE